MAYHREDASYWEKQCEEVRRTVKRLEIENMNLYQQSQKLQAQLDSQKSIAKPPLFVEMGSLLDNLPAETYYFYQVIWVKQGHPIPMIGQPLQIAR